MSCKPQKFSADKAARKILSEMSSSEEILDWFNLFNIKQASDSSISLKSWMILNCKCFCEIKGTSLYWTNLTMIYFVGRLYFYSQPQFR